MGSGADQETVSRKGLHLGLDPRDDLLPDFLGGDLVEAVQQDEAPACFELVPEPDLGGWIWALFADEVSAGHIRQGRRWSRQDRLGVFPQEKEDGEALPRLRPLPAGHLKSDLLEESRLAASWSADQSQMVRERFAREVVPDRAPAGELLGKGPDRVGRGAARRRRLDGEVDEDLLELEVVDALGGQAFDVEVPVPIEDPFEIAAAVAGEEGLERVIYPIRNAVHPAASQLGPDVRDQARDQ